MLLASLANASGHALAPSTSRGTTPLNTLLIVILLMYGFNASPAFLITVSNEVPEHPCVSPVSSQVFERRLIEKYIAENGTDPMNGQPLSEEQLVDIKGKRTESNGKFQLSDWTCLPVSMCFIHYCISVFVENLLKRLRIVLSETSITSSYSKPTTELTCLRRRIPDCCCSVLYCIILSCHSLSLFFQPVVWQSFSAMKHLTNE